MLQKGGCLYLHNHQLSTHESLHWVYLPAFAGSYEIRQQPQPPAFARSWHCLPPQGELQHRLQQDVTSSQPRLSSQRQCSPRGWEQVLQPMFC